MKGKFTVERNEPAIEIDIANIARLLAYADNHEQAKLFNSFAEEYSRVCKDKSFSGMQICYACDELSEQGEELILSMAEFVNLKRNKK